jgi:pimeloyl-ACP methyl ester carboxylesterase
MTKRRVNVNGTTYAVVDEGHGKPVLLLHGFPDSSALWRRQIPVLVDAGYRVIAPDLRGYGDSDKPAEVEGYRLHLVAAEIGTLLGTLGVPRAHVVGHDWGAALAWIIAAFSPDHVDRLVALSVGHPAAMLHRTIEQRQRSWYVLLFQFTGVAEELLQRDDWRLLREFAHGQGDMERYVEDLARPGALTASLNLYRANMHPSRELDPRRPVPPVAAPTLGMWCSRDPFLVEEPMQRSGEFVTGPWRYERIENAGHWLPLDSADRVNELLLEFLRDG